MKMQDWLHCPECESQEIEFHYGNGRLNLICHGGCGQMQSFTMEKENPFQRGT